MCCLCLDGPMISITKGCRRGLAPQHAMLAASQGLSIRLYHPESCPFDTFGYVDEDGNYASDSGLMQVRHHNPCCRHASA